MTINVWHVNPLIPELNSLALPFTGDSPPSANDVATALGLTVNDTNKTMTMVTDTFYLFTYAAGTVPCVFTCIRFAVAAL